MPAALVSNAIREAYTTCMFQVQIAHQEAIDAVSAYWWNLYLIKRDNLWTAEFENFSDWLGDFSVQEFGQSRQTYYSVMNSIERYKRIGKNDEQIKHLLAHRKVALEGDFSQLFSDNGKGDIRPEALARIEAGGETVSEFVDRVAALPAGESRAVVARVSSNEHIFITDDEAVYDEATGRLMFNVQYESNEDGLLWQGTLTITATEIVARRRQSQGNFLPEKISTWLKKKLGIRD